MIETRSGVPDVTTAAARIGECLACHCASSQFVASVGDEPRKGV